MPGKCSDLTILRADGPPPPSCPLSLLLLSRLLAPSIQSFALRSRADSSLPCPESVLIPFRSPQPGLSRSLSSVGYALYTLQM
ncbi:hypothetical protein ASPZODRAFT_136515, partial [Penicilliopsis zonata CBS 506.65]